MQPKRCGKIIHMTRESAELHRDSLVKNYGYNEAPNIYICNTCSTDTQVVYHVGFGLDASKLSKRARRQRKQASARRRKKRPRGSYERRLHRENRHRTREEDPSPCGGMGDTADLSPAA